MIVVPPKPRLLNPAPALLPGYPRPLVDYFNAPGRSGYNPHYQGPGDPYGHGGLDEAAPVGSPAVACADMTIHYLGDETTNPRAGKHVEGTTPAGDAGAWGFRYLHLQTGSILVVKGDRPQAGDRIASVGDTGVGCNYPHLHFEVRWLPGGPRPGSLVSQGYALDPLLFGVLQTVDPVPWPDLLRPGDTDPCVPVLKGILHGLGYLPTAGGTPTYGPRPAAAVGRFQRDRGLTPDRVVGPQTRHALAQAISRALD